MLILVDLDGVCADFEGHFWPLFTALCPDAPVISREDRKTFYVEDEIGQEWRKSAESVIHGEGFFHDLPPFQDAVEGVKKLSESHTTIICTSPVRTAHSRSEKYLWVKRHLGNKYAKEMIICKDKTLVRGDYLIDDRPYINGILDPTWVHILYDQPYNRMVAKPRLDWEGVLNGTHKF